MTIPQYGTPSTSTGGSGNTITLSAPSTSEVGFYVVATEWPGGSDSTDWTPSAAPDLSPIPSGTFAQVWPTITQWEQPWFAFAVHGHADLPALEWQFPSSYDRFAIVTVFIDDCAFLLRAGNLNNAGDNNKSPAGQVGSIYSVRGGIGRGDSSDPPAATSDFALTPAIAIGGSGDGEIFAAMVPSLSSTSPMTVNETEHASACTWATNSMFFPDVWGSTLSIYEPGSPSAVRGWTTGSIRML